MSRGFFVDKLSFVTGKFSNFFVNHFPKFYVGAPTAKTIGRIDLANNTVLEWLDWKYATYVSNPE